MTYAGGAGRGWSFWFRAVKDLFEHAAVEEMEFCYVHHVRFQCPRDARAGLKRA
jgi:hypothetical protein